MKKVLLFLLVTSLIITGCSGEKKPDGKIQKLLKNNKLVVATSADYPPYEFIKSINGKDEIVGFDIEIVKYIANKWEVDFEIKDVKFESLLLGLESGMYDMVIAGMNPSPDRKASFSDIYYSATHGVLVKKENLKNIKKIEDLQGKKLGVQLGTVQEGIVDGLKNVEKKALSLITTLLLELKTEKIDAIIMEKPVAESYALANPDLMVVQEINIEDESGGSAIAMSQENTELTKEVNKVLKEIKEKNLIEKWVVDANNLMNDVKKPDYSYLYIEGLKYTLMLSLFSLFVGFILGLLLVFARRAKLFLFSLTSMGIVEIIRGTPLMLQILIVYYGLDFLGIKMSAFMASFIAVSINSGAYVSEIIRSGIESVPKGQMEAGRSLGLSSAQTMKKIIMPQAIKNILPALGNEFITLIKETSIASTIGVGELMFQTSKIQSLTFEAMKPLLIVSVIYFILTFSLSQIMKIMERRMNYDN